MARSVNFDFRRGGGSTVEVMYGEVTLEPTIMHSVGTSAVIPSPTKFDLIAGKATATNVAPSPDPVDGKVAWAYKVSVKDRHGKKFEWLVGVPDGVPPINFISLPRYFETKPPLFGQGPQGIPGSAATIAVGTTTSGDTPTVTNSGTSTDAILNFTLPKGDKGDTGAGVPTGGTALQVIRKNSGNTTTEWATLDKASVGLSNVDNTSDQNKPLSTATQSAINVSESGTDARVAANLGGAGSLTTQALLGRIALESSSAEGLLSNDAKDLLFGSTPLGTAHLNTVIAFGRRNQAVIANVTSPNGYPVAGSSCFLDVSPYGTGFLRVVQTLTYVVSGRKFQRRSADGGATWTDWIESARLQDIDAVIRDYNAPYSYQLALSDTDNFAQHPTEPLSIVRTGNMVQIVGGVVTTTAGYVSGSSHRKIAQLPDDARQASPYPLFYYMSSGGATYSQTISNSGSVSVYNHSTGDIGSRIIFSQTWAVENKAATMFGRYFGKFLYGIEYQVISSSGSNPSLSTIAIHGGETERGSQECAEELKRLTKSSFYTLDAMLDPTRGQPTYSYVHLTSNDFDDPVAVSLVGASSQCVSFHGAADNSYGTSGAATFLGGLDVPLRTRIANNLRAAGFVVRDNPAEFPALAGTNMRNICNRTTTGAGVQIEMTTTLRKSFFPGNDWARPVRKSGVRTEVFDTYIEAIRTAL